eukprot:COSAG01_NODE_5219_length_4404_cov_19.378397_3_plen_81_part_00
MRRCGPSPVVGYLLLPLPRRSSAAEAGAATSSGCVDGGALACRGSHWVALHPLRPMQAMCLCRQACSQTSVAEDYPCKRG